MKMRKYQDRVLDWVREAFGAEVAANRRERNHRFLEEALELVQSLDCTQEEAHQLVDYVFNRKRGEPVQEVGGVMVTLAALCSAAHIDLQHNAEYELVRINRPAILEKIRKKQAAKVLDDALPGPS